MKRQLWVNGRFVTMRSEGEEVNAIIIQDDKIIKIGDRKDLEPLIELYDEIKDCSGQVYYPGFVDSHMHLIGHGESLLTINLSTVSSFQEVITCVKEKVQQVPPGEWIIAEGFDEELFYDRQKIPTKWELDKLSLVHPIVLKRKCRHVFTANTLALQMASIESTSENPMGGSYDKVNGEITGVMRDRAVDKMLEAMPGKTSEYLTSATRLAIKDAWSKGLVGGHSEDLSYYGNPQNPFQTFIKEVEEGDFPFRLHLLVHHLAVDKMKELDVLHINNTYLELGAIKIFVDGSLGGRTALLSTSYKDAPSTKGIAVHPKEVLEDLVKRARIEKKNIAVHVIGDQAVGDILEVIEKYPCPPNLLDRLIHVPLLNNELIQRMQVLPIIADIQPSFLPSDSSYLHNRIHEEVHTHRFAWKSLLEAGIICAGGSDAPIEDINPLEGIKAAVSRSVYMDGETITYVPTEQLSMYEAISLYTKGSALAIGREKEMGMIAEGYFADFTVFKERLDEIPLQQLTENLHTQTIIGGNIVFTRP
ncbi:amidohydrolase [Mangrovibacillus cuniculi]|uniref:Amidohydrolase n=1 Tax=Mangrovibacillus cuniculi TaxID=2593652 RepID=A0A7S8CC38_9BACI|nr:amidohydrolase [Mangrovibacillus cuniculi]QPC47235.1 amidohydrolase [Mangrovibacillus cuniculi]